MTIDPPLDPTLAGFGTTVADRYVITGTIGTFGGDTPCDDPTATRNADTGECRCVVCSRCNRHTGNSNQGHYWRMCKVTRTLRDFHHCCPGNCELEAAP